ncbi:GDSL esterase/lipase [Actinidia chinensis var. chinensis]|uniref:GDSL esterase/lipase n=1 Tax=Actinidia chinensis var. chinensis TaxID=1590841 RepID=A0A2R6PZI7_ACTCC|nr:GDSL esterase/lipase [Actinidia chinensis var. chinensis]
MRLFQFLRPSLTPLLFIHVFLHLWIAQALVKLPPNVTLPAVIMFGDSVVDTGNNNNLKSIAKVNYPPYGKDFEGGVPTGRFSNGKVPSDILVEELGIKDLLPAYLDPNLQTEDLETGVNFASGGAGFDPLTSAIETAIPLSDQIKLFKEYIERLKGVVGDERTSTILANSLYVVLAGSNDIINTYFSTPIRRSHYDVASYTDLMVTLASSFVKELYGLGAKRIAVFGVPPIGCVPSQRTLVGGVLRECVENYNQAGQLFNTKLFSALDSLSSNLNDPQTRLVYIDIYNPLLDLIQNPKKYGFLVVDRGCCGTGTIEVDVLCNKFSGTCPDDSVYLFWDSFHPTERGYKILVKHILQKYINNFL